MVGGGEGYVVCGCEGGAAEFVEGEIDGAGVLAGDGDGTAVDGESGGGPGDGLRGGCCSTEGGIERCCEGGLCGGVGGSGRLNEVVSGKGGSCGTRCWIG